MDNYQIQEILSIASHDVSFLPILAAAMFYFNHEPRVPENSIIDQPGDMILVQYDFIIVGGGSAGENNISLCILCRIIK